jgi:hypothetical protein
MHRRCFPRFGFRMFARFLSGVGICSATRTMTSKVSDQPRRRQHRPLSRPQRPRAPVQPT